MEAVKKARDRLKLFPKYGSECVVEGVAYAKCVVQTDDPKQYQCDKEFKAFKKCLMASAKKHGSRI